MKFNDYQKEAHRTSDYPLTWVDDPLSEMGERMADFIYPALGLCGEAGEVAEKIKKVIRNKRGKIDDKDVQEIKKELGDTLWYLSEVASSLGLELEDVAISNLEKLADRHQRGVIKSSGDNR